MTMLAGTSGHTFGVRVQRVHKVQRVQRGRLTALRAEGCGRLSAAGYVPTGETTHYILCVAPLLQNVFAVHRFAQGAGKKVLRIDWPFRARGFLGLTGPLAPRVVVSPSWAMSIKSALRDLLSVSYGIVSTTVISHLRWLFPPFGALRHHLPPAERWDNKALKSSPFISSSHHNGAL